MEEVLKAIRNMQNVDEVLTSYIRTHTINEIIELLKSTAVLSYTTLFNETECYKSEVYCIYDIEDVADMIADFRDCGIVYTSGSFDSDYGSYPSVEIKVYGLRIDDCFMNTIRSIRG